MIEAVFTQDRKHGLIFSRFINVPAMSPAQWKNIQSVSIPQLVKERDPQFLEIDKTSRPLYTEIVSCKSDVIRTSTSGGGTGYIWDQYIRLVGFMQIVDSMPLAQAVESALTERDVRVSCNCPAFLWYGYSYLATQMGYNYGSPETIAPTEKNPDGRGRVCKHLLSAFETIKANKTKVTQMFAEYLGYYSLEDFPEAYNQNEKIASLARKMERI